MARQLSCWIRQRRKRMSRSLGVKMSRKLAGLGVMCRTCVAAAVVVRMAGAVEGKMRKTIMRLDQVVMETLAALQVVEVQTGRKIGSSSSKAGCLGASQQQQQQGHHQLGWVQQQRWRLGSWLPMATVGMTLLYLIVTQRVAGLVGEVLLQLQ
jgi:hypothetical protein